MNTTRSAQDECRSGKREERRMITMSALRGCSVVCGQKRLGLLQDLVLNWPQTAVSSLLIACGIRGKRMIPVSSVMCIAKDFILVRNEGYKRYQPKTGNCRFVRDTDGILSGIIRDYAIDEACMSVIAIEILPGYLPRERKTAQWLSTYTRSNSSEDELIIPSALFAGPASNKEENEYAYINCERNGCRQPAWACGGRGTDDDAARQTHEKGYDEKRW